MFRTRVAAIALTGAAMFALTGAPAALAAPTAVAQAAAIPGSVHDFRLEVLASLKQNLSSYGDRLTPSERAHVNALIREVNQDLTGLERATAKTSRLAATHAPKAAQAKAAQAAATAFDAGYAKALANLAEIQPILQPRLNLFEALSAKSDLDTEMSRYQALGEQIHAVAASPRA